MSMDKKLFRDRVIEALDSGWSVANLTRQAGVKYDIVRDLKRRPDATTSIENAEKIARALGKTLDELLYGVDDGVVSEAKIMAILNALNQENLVRVLERAQLLFEMQEAEKQAHKAPIVSGNPKV